MLVVRKADGLDDAMADQLVVYLAGLLEIEKVVM